MMPGRSFQKRDSNRAARDGDPVQQRFIFRTVKGNPYQFADKRIVQDSGHSFKIHLHDPVMDDEYCPVLRADLWLHGVSFPEG